MEQAWRLSGISQYVVSWNIKSPNLTPKKVWPHYSTIAAWTLHPNEIVDIITFALTPLACTPCYLSYYILLYLVSILKHNCKVQLAFSIDKRDCILDSSAIVGSFLTTALLYYWELITLSWVRLHMYIWEEYLFISKRFCVLQLKVIEMTFWIMVRPNRECGLKHFPESWAFKSHFQV